MFKLLRDGLLLTDASVPWQCQDRQLQLQRMRRPCGCKRLRRFLVLDEADKLLDANFRSDTLDLSGDVGMGASSLGPGGCGEGAVFDFVLRAVLSHRAASCRAADEFLENPLWIRPAALSQFLTGARGGLEASAAMAPKKASLWTTARHFSFAVSLKEAKAEAKQPKAKAGLKTTVQQCNVHC